MTDDPQPDGAPDEPGGVPDAPGGVPDAPEGNQARAAAGYPVDPRFAQRNLANRLFPGPSRGMSRQRTDHIGRLLRPLDNSTPPAAWPDRPARTRAPGDRSRPTQAASADHSPALAEPSPAAAAASPGTADDPAPLLDKLEQHNELLRAILANSVDAQEDARATAQNSRTFAWAGTAIALLTLIATVVSIVAVTVH